MFRLHSLTCSLWNILGRHFIPFQRRKEVRGGITLPGTDFFLQDFSVRVLRLNELVY